MLDDEITFNFKGKHNTLLSKQVETLSKRLFQSERELLQYDAIFYTMCEIVLWISNLLQSLSAMFH